MDVRAMNKCLLSKWIDRLERGDEILCCELLRKKYLGEKYFPNQESYRVPILERYSREQTMVSNGPLP